MDIYILTTEWLSSEKCVSNAISLFLNENAEFGDIKLKTNDTIFDDQDIFLLIDFE